MPCHCLPQYGLPQALRLPVHLHQYSSMWLKKHLRRCALQSAVYGNFSAPKAQEVVVSRGQVLELLRPNESGKLQVVVSTDVFGVIRSLAAFRLTGASRDYVVLGTDSGRIVILEYSKVSSTTA